MPPAVLLINTNTARPPVSPVGLEYTGEALIEAGIPVRVLDLSFEADWKASLVRELKQDELLAVGLSVRNTDDCSFLSRKSFLPWVGEVVAEARRLTAAPLFLGGAGFSTMPEISLEVTQADGGIEGDGEEAMVNLARSLAKGDDWTQLPNMVYWRGRRIVRNLRVDVDLRYLPVPRRRIFDNKRYEQLGAMVGIETKRGCSQGCIFCADPVAKGRRVRLRPPQAVVQELQDLVEQGVSWLHLCDSEFNLPMNHAKDVCRAIIEKGLGNRIKWYVYCSPTPFDQELARLMKRAGCFGINFGVDSLCDAQLKQLGKTHSLTDIEQLVRLLRSEEINYILDLIIGGPGETEETVKATIEKVRELDILLAGMAVGVRVYPETPLSQAIADGSIKGGLYPEAGHELYEPVFYLSPYLGKDVAVLIKELVAGDPRFLVLASPTEEGSYNYADDEVLAQLIKEGARGAYWDIISRSRKASKGTS